MAHTPDTTSNIIPIATTGTNQTVIQKINYGEIIDTDPSATIQPYEIVFATNFNTELADILSLKYTIRNVETNSPTIQSGILPLSAVNTDNKEIPKSVLDSSLIDINILGTLPSEFHYKKLYWTVPSIADKFSNTEPNFTQWNAVDINATGIISTNIPANILKSGGLVVTVILEKVKTAPVPSIQLPASLQNINTYIVRESDIDKEVTISFTTINTEYVDVYISPTEKIRVYKDTAQQVAAAGVNETIIDTQYGNSVKLTFNKHFSQTYGHKQVVFVPVSSGYGTGIQIQTVIAFTQENDFPSITSIVYPTQLDIPAFSDFNVTYDVIYESISTTSIDVFLLDKNTNKIKIYSNISSNGKITINTRELAKTYSNWNGSKSVVLVFIPYNRGGDKELIGQEYEIKTNLLVPTVFLSDGDLKSIIGTAFDDLLTNLQPDKESKYVTHLANFDENNQILISSWEADDWTLSKKTEDEIGNQIILPENIVSSTILKLYSPLPSDIKENSTFWVTKILANPLIETVVLTGQDDIDCPVIAGPNFDIEVDFVAGRSTNYESIDSLILSTSVSSSSDLTEMYIDKPLVDSSELNIQYVSGSEYLWTNFAKFSSAKERVDNFVYKVQLIESYESLIEKSSTDYTSGGEAYYTASLASQQEIERQSEKKRKIIQGFDGFDKFLYTSSSYTDATSASLTWPYDANGRLDSTSSIVIDWYNNISELAEIYDTQNSSWILNNIPAYITNNEENNNFILFLSMMGHHFDNIYFYTKAIERSRQITYTSKNGIANKLLFDKLKSFNWDAKNLSVDSNLWEYALGLNSDGAQKFSSPAKQRTYEIWRRIINNLPYLLKNKGTRRGIYALLACYGVPSSNLTITEYGGPEVSDENKGKFEFDVISTAIQMDTTSTIDVQWSNTKYGRKPDDIEIFIKPYTAGVWDIISGSDWGVVISGSVDSKYGNVIFNYTGSINVTSSILPIFNGDYFGINLSRQEAGDTDLFTLDVTQRNSDRTIFTSTVTASVSSSWDDGELITIGGGTNGYSGSVDEFRLWSLPLSSSTFYEHVSFPEMINGNSVSASTDDLHFRLDFEYPKDLSVYTTMPNVDTNIYYSQSLSRNYIETNTIIKDDNIFSLNEFTPYSASLNGFVSITEYPYQFEVIERNALLQIPSIGLSSYSTNKVRFETQELVSDLSPNSRSTKKSLDQAPIDSNRIGVFFSPTKELNIDIAKSIGGIRLDDYIGNPSDKWEDTYSELDSLRKQYFNRIDKRDVYEYINLVKLYEKAMFDDIKQMVPARAKLSTGLLIEPHILERNKIKQRPADGESTQQVADINYDDTTDLLVENINRDMLIDADLSENLQAVSNQIYSEIDEMLADNLLAHSYQLSDTYDASDDITIIPTAYQQFTYIDTDVDRATIQSNIELLNSNQVIGQSVFENIGFGVYAQSGSAIRTYRDNNGGVKRERIRLHIVTEQKSRTINKYNTVVDGQGDPRNGYIQSSSVYTESTLTIQPYIGSDGNPTTPPTAGNNILKVVPLNGYATTHYIHTNDLTRGMQNSFYRGAKNTASSTIDGAPVVEVFISNPNTLRVNKADRDSSEPILEVE